MTIYAVFGESECGDSTEYDSSASYVDTNYHRGSCSGESGSAIKVTLSDQTKTDLWFHLALVMFSVSFTQDVWFLYDTDDDAILKVESNTTNDELIVKYYDGAAWQTVGSVSASNGTVYYIDIHFDMADTGGEIRCFANQTEIGSITGDTLFMGGQAFSYFEIIDTLTRVRCAEAFVADVQTIGWRMLTREPTGDGNSTTWTGDYADVDDLLVPDDANFISSDTALQKELFVSSKTLPVDGLQVKGVAVAARARYVTGAPANMRLLLRTGATDYESDQKALNSGFNSFQYVWDTNPNTAAAWQRSEADAFEFGVKSET